MKHWYQQSYQPLSEYVRTVLILEGSSLPDPGYLPLVTKGMSALFCKTERNEKGNEDILQLVLYGKSVPEECWTIKDNITIIAYFFKPFSLPVLFNTAAAGLAKAPLDLHSWNAHKANAVKTQLAFAVSTERKVEVMDNLLIHQLQQQSRECEIIKYATDQVMLNPDAEVLSRILKQLNLTERTFQRTFKKYVGITPGQYRRLCQFQGSFTQLRTQDFDKLTDVAYDNGFADQSHFIRSFKEFAQTTPLDYLKSGLKEKK